MHWQMGFKETNSEVKKGSLNEVIGISVKDSAGKLRGKRGAFIGLEEFGSFPNLIELYGTLRPSMEDGDIVFGMIFAQGCVCAGTKVFDKYGNLINIEDANSSIMGYNGINASVEEITYLQQKPSERVAFVLLERRCCWMSAEDIVIKFSSSKSNKIISPWSA